MVRNTLRPSFALAAVALVAVFAAAGTAEASNMAFKLNKQTWALGGGGVKGKNLIALPARSPYQGAGGMGRLCTALGLSSSAQLLQFDGTGGIFVYVCGTIETFSLLDGRGIMVTDSAAHTGILVGSDLPGKVINVFDLGTSPVGTNLFPVDYHTTAVTPEDLCVQCGLSNQAAVTRFDANVGQVFTHTCGSVPLWTLVLGEAVMILEPNGPKACSPSHF